jgi:Tfp pilus assembly protein PilF
MDLVGPHAEELLEYEARTIASTWTISLKQVRSHNEDAAELLTFLAYLNNRDIWYDLLKAGASDEVPWMRRVTESKVHFQRAMSKLYNYSLVDVIAGSYQVHPCLHDWLVECLNTPPDFVFFMTALGCIADSIDDQSTPQFWIANRRLLEHTEQLQSPRFRELWQLSASEERVLAAAHGIAGLQREWDRLEKALGPDHTSTLDTVNNLGLLYCDQGKLNEAEEMFRRALAGRKKALGPDHTSTLGTVNNLGLLYCDQGKLDVAEEMFRRALAGREKALGPDHTSTLGTVNNLGLLCCDQGKLDVAEEVFRRALAGREKALGPDHTSTLDTVNNLGLLYRNQGKLGMAEEMFRRALAGREKALGPDHTSTLGTVNNLGLLYCNQGKLDVVEEMFRRALAGHEKALGPDHTTTLDTVNNLGLLYRNQGKLGMAEEMFRRALAGREKILSPDHTSTLDTVHNLGMLPDQSSKLTRSGVGELAGIRD